MLPQEWLINIFLRAPLSPAVKITISGSSSLSADTMLSDKEKTLIAEIWNKLIPVAEDIGSDALLSCRGMQDEDLVFLTVPYRFLSAKEAMFVCYPGTKTYFSHIDISPGSPHLLIHGKKIVLAIAEGAQDIDQLAVNLAPLQTYHAYQLRIHPTNFKLFSYCVLVSLAVHMGENFTDVAHAAMDKYLSAFAAVLAEKYR